MGDNSLEEEDILKKLERVQELYAKGHSEAATNLEKNIDKDVKYTPMKESADQAMELIKEQERGINPNAEAYMNTTGENIPDKHKASGAKPPANSAKGGADGVEDVEKPRTIEPPKPRPGKS